MTERNNLPLNTSDVQRSLPDVADSGDNPDDEFSIETVSPVVESPSIEQSTAVAERGQLTALVLGVKERYAAFKKNLLERTDKTLETVADTYVEKYEAARDPRTGEVPSSYFSRIRRAVDTVRSSVSLATAVELGCRAALRPLEFSAGMAARYTFVDFAVKAVEYAQLEKTYNAQGGVKAIEDQAMNFANQVRQHFESLGAMADNELPGAEPDERESFRQKKISEGIAHAETLLQGTHITPEAQKKILADLRIYLDTTVYDPSRSTLLRQWDKLGRGYEPAIRELVTKHIDIYQKRQERNRSLIRSVAMISTFGLESYVVSRALSAKTALTTNYEKELIKLPAEQRTQVERMRALGRSVQEGMAQLLMTDTFRQTRLESTRIDDLVAGLLSEDIDARNNQEFDALVERTYEAFKSQLEAKGLSRDWLYDQLDTAVLQKVGKRRAELSRILKTQLYDLHRRQVKSIARQAEHLYDQYNVNITALSIMGNADMAVEEVTRVRDGIGVILEHASGGQINPSIATADQDVFESLPTEPQLALATHAAETIIQAVQAHKDQLQTDTIRIEQPLETPAENIEFGDLEEIPEEAQSEFGPEESLSEELPNIVLKEHVIEKGDTLWGLAEKHLSEYQIRTGNFELNIPQAVAIIRADNDMGTSSNLEVGQSIKLSSTNEVISGESTINPYELGESGIQQYKDMARGVDNDTIPDNYVPVDRTTVDTLPPGEYYMTLGERMGKANGAMPVYYEQVVLVSVDAEGYAEVHNPKNILAPGIALDVYLADHKNPIVRVFQVEGETPQVEKEALDMSTWSQRSIALIRHMQENPESNVKAGEYCSKFAAGQFDFFAPGLAEDLGVALVNGEGESTGVVVHAPMWEAGLESVGGSSVVSLSEYFNHDKNGTPPITRLETGDAEYRERVGEWIQEARVPLRQATAQYDYTKIRDYIENNEELGGSENSHVMNLYGDKTLVGEATRDMTLARYLAQEHHVDRKDLAERGWLFEELGIEVNGTVVTTQEDWEALRLQKGDVVTVHDIAINHRYGGDVADSLVTLMVRKGAYTPVAITEGNPAIINEALAYQGEGGNFAIETFHKVESGDTMAKILAEQNVPRDVWMASVFAMRADGYVDPDHLKPGQLVQIYDTETLRANIEQIYATEEARMLAGRDEVSIHIIRPGESMDEITSHYFERDRYSTAEWAQLRNVLAGRIPEITLTNVQMPGDEFTPPYTVTEYNYKADTILEISKTDLAALDEMIIEQRLAERTYLPDTMPIRTAEGTVEETLPAEIRWLINDSIDRHPEYTERERAAAALVFANEGLRETADKNDVSDAIVWVRDNIVQPTDQIMESIANAVLDKAGITTRADAQNTEALSALVGVSEYLSSRQMAKDVAWWIHDTPAAAEALDQALFYAKLDISHDRITDVMHQVGLGESDIELYNDVATKIDAGQDKIAGALEKIQGVSSAGIFQVRANNFVAEGDAGRNTTEEVFGHRMSYDQLETELRANPMLNVDAATHILHENALVINTYIDAFGDPRAGDESAIIVAIANSYNGGPYKTMLGGLQVGIRDIGADLGISDLALDKATGRNTDTTQTAFVQICTRLAEEGKIQRTPDEIAADAKLLGSNTIAFLRSETMQQFKQAYGQTTGEALSLLPKTDRLDDADVSYGNYGYLAIAGGALDAIQQYSLTTREKNTSLVLEGIARDYTTRPINQVDAG